MITAIVCFSIMALTYFICKTRELSQRKREHQDYLRLSRTKEQTGKPDSPYKLKRVMHKTTQTWGYTFAFKESDEIYDHNGAYEILPYGNAKSKLNEVETAEGYETTKWD